MSWRVIAGLGKVKGMRAQLLVNMQQQTVPIKSCSHDWDIMWPSAPYLTMPP